jgi:hypothetical protein
LVQHPWVKTKWRNLPRPVSFRGALLLERIRTALHELNHFVTAKLIGAQVLHVDFGHTEIRLVKVRYLKTHGHSTRCRRIKSYRLQCRTHGETLVLATDRQHAFLDKIDKGGDR